MPVKYPSPSNSCLLENEGEVFTDITNDVAPEIRIIGMVTSALWMD